MIFLSADDVAEMQHCLLLYQANPPARILSRRGIDMSIVWIGRLLKQFGGLYISGTIMTLEISVLGTFLGYVLGFLVGVVQSSKADLDEKSVRTAVLVALKQICRFYVFIFRGTPMIVQAMVIYFGSLQALGLDLSPFTAAVIVVSLNTGAYMAETVRGGFQSVDAGQVEGALALGMPYLKIMLLIVIPQALRNIFPQMGNTFISNIKDTSVLNIISVSELFFTTKTVAGSYYKYFEAYTITAVIYLMLTFVFNLLFNFLEQRMADKANYELVDVDEYERALA